MPEIKYEHPQVERLPSSETPEHRKETVVHSIETSEPSVVAPSLNYLPKSGVGTQLPNLNLNRRVEDILSSGLENIYLDMDSNTQAKFRAKGEETSAKIADLISRGKATLKKVLSLLIDWLRIIPGVNKHFLEQEAKIRADNIMNIRK